MIRRMTDNKIYGGALWFQTVMLEEIRLVAVDGRHNGTLDESDNYRGYIQGIFHSFTGPVWTIIALS